MPKLSQYEIEREANIARNRALLEELELKQAVEGISLGKSKAKPAAETAAKPVQPNRKLKRERNEPEAPRRQSSRLKKEAIDLSASPAKRQKREAEIEEERAREAEARLEAEERARVAKRPRHHDLELAVLAQDEVPEDVSRLSDTMRIITQTSQPRCVGDPDLFASKDSKVHEAAVAELREKLEDLVVISRAKVTMDRVYSAAYHPEVSKDLVFFGDKHGQLGIWDARAPTDEVEDEDGDASEANNREGGKYWRLQCHWPATSKSSISCIKFDPINSHNLYTSSYDCTIRCLSFTSGISREIYSTDEAALITSIDLTPDGHEMWISDGQGGAAHLDLREDSSRARWYGLSDLKIGSISINPTSPHFVLTASNNRSLKIWDTRNLRELSTDLSDDAPPTPPASSPGGPDNDIKHEAAATTSPLEFNSQTITEFLETKKGKSTMRAEWRHNKSVSSAYWDPRGRSIVSTSYDDTLRLWDIEPSQIKSTAPFKSSRPFSQLHHDCQTGRWLTILRAQWSPNPDAYPHFTVGNMNHSVNIFSCKGDLIAKLADRSRITAVQAVTCSHPSIVERVATGNGSGRCVLWAPANTK
ncbi:WD40 repeat-like protein [Infundibulicybe gibba]|nr:WD40 repeat-like protein [Infundibulicybe gibba]